MLYLFWRTYLTKNLEKRFAAGNTDTLCTDAHIIRREKLKTEIFLTVFNIAVLLIASFFDIRTREVPPALFFIGIAVNLITKALFEPYPVVLVSFGYALFLFVLIALIGFLDGENGFGGADALAMAMIGAFINDGAVLAVPVSALLALPCLLYIKIKKIKKPYPFIPFITVSCILVIIFSEKIIPMIFPPIS